VDGGWTDDKIACGGSSLASMRGGALVSALDRTRSVTQFVCIHEYLDLNINREASFYHEYK
jgi:hypothetical protein